MEPDNHGVWRTSLLDNGVPRATFGQPPARPCHELLEGTKSCAESKGDARHWQVPVDVTDGRKNSAVRDVHRLRTCRQLAIRVVFERYVLRRFAASAEMDVLLVVRDAAVAKG